MGFGPPPSWMTALETQFALLRAWRHTGIAETHHSYRLMTQHIPYALSRAMPYAWTGETATAVVMASQTIPEETKLGWAMLPKTFEAPMWWWFDEPLPWSAPGHTGLLAVRGLLIYIGSGFSGRPLLGGDLDDPDVDNDSPALKVVVHGGGDDDLVGIEWLCTFEWELEKTLRQNVADFDLYRRPDQAPLTEADQVFSLQLMRFLSAAFVWLDQRIVQYSAGHIERHRKKQLVAEHKGPVPSEVKVIQLRRADPAGPGGIVPGPQDVEWSCRWIVSGHWRNQAYANGEHKLIYILPYVKGPDDKPLKVPSHTVYSVSR